MTNLKRKFLDGVGIATRKDILIILEAIINREEYGQLSPDTMNTLKGYRDYYKERETNK